MKNNTENELLSLFDDFDEGICVIDIDSNEFIYYNKSYKKLFEVSDNEKCYKAFAERNKACEICPKENITGINLGKKYIEKIYNKKNASWYKRINKAININGKIAHYVMIIDISKKHKIQENTTLANSFFNNSVIAILQVDVRTKKILNANNTALELYNYTKKDILTKDIYDLNAVSKAETNNIIRKYLSRKNDAIIIKQKTSDNRIIDTELYLNSIFENNRRIMYIIAIDITNRIKNEEEINTLYTAIEQSTSSIVITDKDGKIEYVNPFFTKVTGYSKDEAIGENPRILKSDKNNPQIYTELWSTISAGKVWSGEFTNKRKDGTLYSEHATIAPVKYKNGRIKNFIAIKRDISKIKIAEEKIILQNEQLKVEKLKAEQSDKLKSRFLSNMSHEIRTPLNAIIGFSDLLTMPNIKDEKKELFKHHIHNNSKHLLNLISDILEISKIEAGDKKYTETEVDVTKLIEDLQAYFTLYIKDFNQKDLKIVTETKHEKLVIITDETKFQQVFRNLINNAIKFTDTGEITIGYTIANQKNKEDSIIFYVKDTGAGIPQSKQTNIFKRFHQLDDSTTRKHDGIGLGLYITKQCMNILKGDIWLESEKDTGSTFFFRLPLKTPNNEVLTQEKELSKFNKNLITINKLLRYKKILIAEDNDYAFMLLQEILEEINIDNIRAKNGVEALEFVKNDSDIKLILMDVQMPVLNGIDATISIKKTNPEIPIIIQTAYAFSENKKQIIDSGCNDYITKPINKLLLIEKIVNTFSKL